MGKKGILKMITERLYNTDIQLNGIKQEIIIISDDFHYLSFKSFSNFR